MPDQYLNTIKPQEHLRLVNEIKRKMRAKGLVEGTNKWMSVFIKKMRHVPPIYVD